MGRSPHPGYASPAAPRLGRVPRSVVRPRLTVWQQLKRWLNALLRLVVAQFALPRRPRRSRRALPPDRSGATGRRLLALPPAKSPPAPNLLRNTYIPTRSWQTSSSALVVFPPQAARSRRITWLLGMMVAATSLLATALVVLVANLTLRLWQNHTNRPSSDMGSASPPTSASIPVSYQIQRLRQAIIAQESGGDHQLMNASGSGAMGLGQIMPENLPIWSQEVLGRELSTQEFLDSPTMQVQIMDHKLAEYWQKALIQANGDLDETVMRVAAWWYSGDPHQFWDPTPQVWNGDRYPSVAEYSASVLGHFSRNRPSI